MSEYVKFIHKHDNDYSTTLYNLQLYPDNLECKNVIDIFDKWVEDKNNNPFYQHSLIEEVVYILHDKDIYNKDIYLDTEKNQNKTIPHNVKNVENYLSKHPYLIKKISAGTRKKPHYHIILLLKEKITRQELANLLNVPVNLIECCDYKYMNNLFYYLTHLYDKNKYHYEISDIKGYVNGKYYKRSIYFNSPEKLKNIPDKEIFDICTDLLKYDNVEDESELISFLLKQKFPMTIFKARMFALSFKNKFKNQL